MTEVWYDADGRRTDSKRVPVRKGRNAKSTQVQRDRTKYQRASEKRPHRNEEESE